MILRTKELNELISYQNIKLIKIITGVRRCGKSTLLMQYKDYLETKEKISQERILYLNFESIQWDFIKNYHDLYKYIESKYNHSKIYILLDEVQNIIHWEKAVNSFLTDFDCDICITGSNAYLLSSELSTLLSGRIATIHLLPFSFKEYILENKESNLTKEQLFDKYFIYGSMPMINAFKDNNLQITNYLNDIKDVVLKNDVISRNNVKDVVLLENLLKYVSSTIGLLITPNSISDELCKNGYNTRNETVDNYLCMLENAYIIYKAQRYNIQGKQILKTQGKYYFVDLGIRNNLNGFSQIESGSAYENLVYLELIRRGYIIYTGKYNDLEIDFIAIKPEKTIYIQVCKTLNDSTVEEREKKSLLSVNDNYEKIIITVDTSKNKTIEGIKIMNIIDFLLMKEEL